MAYKWKWSGVKHVDFIGPQDVPTAVFVTTVWRSVYVNVCVCVRMHARVHVVYKGILGAYTFTC